MYPPRTPPRHASPWWWSWCQASFAAAAQPLAVRACVCLSVQLGTRCRAVGNCVAEAAAALGGLPAVRAWHRRAPLYPSLAPLAATVVVVVSHSSSTCRSLANPDHQAIGCRTPIRERHTRLQLPLLEQKPLKFGRACVCLPLPDIDADIPLECPVEEIQFQK